MNSLPRAPHAPLVPQLAASYDVHRSLLPRVMTSIQGLTEKLFANGRAFSTANPLVPMCGCNCSAGAGCSSCCSPLVTLEGLLHQADEVDNVQRQLTHLCVWLGLGDFRAGQCRVRAGLGWALHQAAYSALLRRSGGCHFVANASHRKHAISKHCLVCAFHCRPVHVLSRAFTQTAEGPMTTPGFVCCPSPPPPRIFPQQPLILEPRPCACVCAAAAGLPLMGSPSWHA